ncbi:class I SAM-dependent RNA methyltransferase [Chloroflexus sp.]|uniref:class I SAM-dependent RNA methyltransferase n=1 Tax=Chloroflexus sp. TaxID=1904827 RepID=UPI002ADE0020|nr:class I SAM-dependent RNA methyltransferase [Chloroflexus sp.]
MHDTIELEIEGIAQGGDGVGRYGDLVVFVTGALPGEMVRATITEHHTRFLRATVCDILRTAPERVEPQIKPGDHAPWQHIAYPAQVRYKGIIVADQLRKFLPDLNIPIQPVIAAPHPWGYRNSAHLHGDGATLGYHAAGTKTVVDLADDPLLLPALRATLLSLRRLPFAGLIKEVTLRASATYGYAAARLSPIPDAERHALWRLATAWKASTPMLAGVTLEDEPFVGTPFVYDELDGVIFRLSLGSFFQVNHVQAERMVAVVRDALVPHGGRLLDAYSGVGSFALPLARCYDKVIAVESYQPAVEDGRQSAIDNQITNVQFINGAAERTVAHLSGPFHAVILDPPRRGCHPALIEAIIAHAPPQIVYISCHPGLIGRDIAPLLAAGYQITFVQPIDLFPQTPHIETIIHLRSRVRE